MKKALSFAVALGLVAGMVSTAAAEDMLTIKGDARWRGVHKDNTTDSSDDGDDTMRFMDQRYRFDAQVEEIYPITLLAAGAALNVTAYSYGAYFLPIPGAGESSSEPSCDNFACEVCVEAHGRGHIRRTGKEIVVLERATC